MSPPCRQSEALWRTSREYNARYYRVVIMAATANKRVRRPIFRHWSLYNRFPPRFLPSSCISLYLSPILILSLFLLVSRLVFPPFLNFLPQLLRNNSSLSKLRFAIDQILKYFALKFTYRRFANSCKFSSIRKKGFFLLLFKECSKY